MPIPNTIQINMTRIKVGNSIASVNPRTILVNFPPSPVDIIPEITKPAGLVISGIMSTGLGGKLTSIVLGLTEAMLLPTLILVMLICIVLGMGMPVAAAYILTAMLAA